MKITNYIILLLCSAFVMQSCTKEKDNLIDSTALGSITVKGVKNAIDVYTGATFQLEVEPVPADAPGANNLVYTFSSSDESIFTVNEEGLIEGVSVGEAYLQIGVEEFPDIVSAYLVRVADEIFLVEEIVLADEYKELKVPIQGDEIVNAISLLPGISFLPENATNKDVEFVSSDTEVIDIDANGNLIAKKIGEATITIRSTDGTDVSVAANVNVRAGQYPPTDRSRWTVTTSHELPKDDAIKNAPESLIDGNGSTALSMVKPGKSYDGISVDADEEVFFIIDMGKQQAFDYIAIDHRTSVSYDYLRPHVYTLYGSNSENAEEEDFTAISSQINALPLLDNFTMNFNTANYRYLKVVIEPGTENTSGSTMQIAELRVGKRN